MRGMRSEWLPFAGWYAAVVGSSPRRGNALSGRADQQPDRIEADMATIRVAAHADRDRLFRRAHSRQAGSRRPLRGAAGGDLPGSFCDGRFIRLRHVPKHDVIVRLLHARMAGVVVQINVVHRRIHRAQSSELLVFVDVLQRHHVDRADQRPAWS